MYTVKQRVQADFKPVKPGNILATKIPDKSEQTDNTKNVNTTDNGFQTKMLKSWRSGASGNDNIPEKFGLMKPFAGFLPIL